MRPPAIHIPGAPVSDEPSRRLLQINASFVHPLVHHTGITCDADGEWALLLAVPSDADVPIPEIEAQLQGVRIVYEAQPDAPLTPFAD